jgi:hypothetical protein
MGRDGEVWAGLQEAVHHVCSCSGDHHYGGSPDVAALRPRRWGWR